MVSYRHFERKREIFVICGQAVDIRESQTRNLLIRRPSGIAIIYTLRRFYILMRRTAISHFSFLISHSSKAFIPSQGGSTPHRLALTHQPFYFTSTTPNFPSCIFIRIRSTTGSRFSSKLNVPQTPLKSFICASASRIFL